MSKNLLEDAPFLSVVAPKESIIDYSQRLSAQAVQSLKAQCDRLNYKAKVVILPGDYSPGAGIPFDQFCRVLATQWQVRGNRFLLVIDVKGHQARGFSGNGLESQGISSDYISAVVLRGDFITHMRSGDLDAAISSALGAVNAKLVSKSAAVITSEKGPIAATPAAHVASSIPVQHADSSATGGLVFAGVLLAVVAALFWARYKATKSRLANKLYADVKVKLASLYERADLIGQAAEYLDHYQHGELAQQVAKMFNRFAVLNAADNEMARLEKQNKLANAYNDLRKVDKMAEMLLAESSALLPRINAATGFVQSSEIPPPLVAEDFERDARALVQKEDREREEQLEEKKGAEEQARRLRAEERDRIRLKLQLENQQEEPFLRPSWAYQPVYYQPVLVNDPWAGVHDYIQAVSMADMNQRFNESQVYYSEVDRRSSRDTLTNRGSSWGSLPDSNDNSSWGSSSSSSDYGSSSDAPNDSVAGSDFSGGDGGSSW